MVVLETPRLIFRDHEIGDLEAFCAMEADPEVRRFVGGSPRSRTEAERKFQTTYLRPHPDRLGLWATVLKSNGDYIGYCGVYPHFSTEAAVSGEGTLAFYLARAHWGRGFATEAGLAFVGFAFSELGLSRLVAAAEVGNEASSHVLKKLGFDWQYLEAANPRSFNHYELRGPRA